MKGNYSIYANFCLFLVHDLGNSILKDGKRLRGNKIDILLGNVKELKNDEDLEGFFDMLDCYDLSNFM